MCPVSFRNKILCALTFWVVAKIVVKIDCLICDDKILPKHIMSLLFFTEMR